MRACNAAKIMDANAVKVKTTRGLEMKRLVEKVNGDQLSLDCLHMITLKNSLQVGDQTDCSQCDQLIFPDGLTPYKKTPIFNQETIPKGFRRAHSTKQGVWALITVLSGKVRYVVDHLESKSSDLDQHSKGVISPQMEHHLDVIDDVELYVEFYTK